MRDSLEKRLIEKNARKHPLETRCKKLSSGKPRGKRKGGRKAPWKGGRGPAAPPLRAPCPRWGRTRPARARRPVLPRTWIRSTLGDGGLSCRVRDGSGSPTSVAALAQGAPCAFAGTSRAPWRPHSVVRETFLLSRPPAPGSRGREARARAISTARLNASRRLQLRPIDLVVYEGPYRRENSSRRRLPA